MTKAQLRKLEEMKRQIAEELGVELGAPKQELTMEELKKQIKKEWKAFKKANNVSYKNYYTQATCKYSYHWVSLNKDNCEQYWYSKRGIETVEEAIQEFNETMQDSEWETNRQIIDGTMKVEKKYDNITRAKLTMNARQMEKGQFTVNCNHDKEIAKAVKETFLTQYHRATETNSYSEIIIRFHIC